ncbi:hypothetical protein LCGC14_1048070 [marine sediment metagenome]|uniref:Uncharacterized protein n=1 Tax=marine sediment metagenome TaxID=412755 RepID=A0A0F9Q7V6_9ZZZZ
MTQRLDLYTITITEIDKLRLVTETMIESNTFSDYETEQLKLIFNAIEDLEYHLEDNNELYYNVSVIKTELSDAKNDNYNQATANDICNVLESETKKVCD